MESWHIALLSMFGTTIIGLQGWILIKLTDHEKQLFRLVSDRESEKRTISERHKEFDRKGELLEGRVRDLERHHA